MATEVLAPIGLSSADGLIALLDEEEADLRVFALSRLNDLVDQFWTEIAEHIRKIVRLHDDRKFTHSNLAALVAAKVYYHLGSLDEAVQYALKAGPLFDLTVKSEFVDTITAACIDEYIQKRVAQFEGRSDGTAISAELSDVVERMFQRCLSDKQYEQAIGIAMESRRTDVIERVVLASSDQGALLAYCFRVARDVVQHRQFRQEVLRLLVSLYGRLAEPDFLHIVQCHIFGDNPAAVAELMQALVRGSEEHTLIAYQIAFELSEIAAQKFLAGVRDALGEGETESATGQRIGRLREILTGEVSIQLYMEFLFKNNHTDMQILKNLKGWVDPRISIAHSAVVFSNALMHAGTTLDSFLRQNMDWLARATNWAKFSATASLGVIHKGHIKNALALLGPYLPGSGPTSSPFSEGGSLYALGLIHANHGAAVTPTLIKYLNDACEPAAAQSAASVAAASQGQQGEINSHEIVQHGACLGLGLAAMGTANEEVVGLLLNKVLKQQSAVSGEAAGYAIGMLLLGAGETELLSFDDMFQIAHDSRHEKIIRGVAVSIALMLYGREESADNTIARMVSDEDPILRYGGMYAIALAYCGTANNKAIRKLLHIAVSDVSDDVRRSAVLALGFVLLREPEQVPRMVALLAESYNPHVRYGAAMAIGIACSATAMPEAVELLETLAADSVDFVRQGAFMALAMVLIQTSEAQSPKVEKVRKMFDKVVQEKHEDLLAKFGAIIASGIIDAGGRNVSVGLQRSGHLNMAAIAGITLFLQHWYWFPMLHFVSLAFTPTALIGLNADLKMPVFQFKSNARPALFAYPSPVQPVAAAAPKKVAAAVLSTTARAAKRRAEKERLKSGTAPMEGIHKPTEGGADDASAAAGAAAAPATPKEEPKKFDVLENPARVTQPQQRFISFDVDERYKPATEGIRSGIVMLKDSRPGEPQQLVNVEVPTQQAEEPEPTPPEPFDVAE